MRDHVNRSQLKAIVFDVDGTLYRQGPLRRAMSLRLLRHGAMRPLQGWRTLRTLSAYRRAQETLREDVSGDVEAAQFRIACDKVGGDEQTTRACIDRWMHQEPLPLLRQCRREGLVDFLHACRTRGLRLGALSDYPAASKLEALEISEFFDTILCAQQREIGSFKPHPRGIQIALRRLDVSPDECLYVGDRPEVDFAAAQAAGVPCVIIGDRRNQAAAGYRVVNSYAELQTVLLS